jgi:hypothetical protein
MPDERNAGVGLIPLTRHSRANKAAFLLHAGWVPFRSTFNDTYIFEVDEEEKAPAGPV